MIAFTVESFAAVGFALAFGFWAGAVVGWRTGRADEKAAHARGRRRPR